MAESKTRPTGEPVADFLGRIADPQRRRDCETVAGMMRSATGATPEMWGTSIVGFGRYLSQLANGKSEPWPIIGFSPRKNDLTIYLMPGFEQQAALMAKLGKHKTGKVCLYLKRLSDVDVPTLQALIDQSVAAMASRRVDR